MVLCCELGRSGKEYSEYKKHGRNMENRVERVGVGWLKRMDSPIFIAKQFNRENHEISTIFVGGELIQKKHLPYPSYKCDKFVKIGELARPMNQGKNPRHQGPEIGLGNMARDTWAGVLDGTVELYASNSRAESAGCFHGAFSLSSYLHRRGTTSRGYGSLQEPASTGTPSDGSLRGGLWLHEFAPSCLPKFFSFEFEARVYAVLFSLLNRMSAISVNSLFFQSFHRTHSKRTTQSSWSSVHSPTSIRGQHRHHLMQRPWWPLSWR